MKDFRGIKNPFNVLINKDGPACHHLVLNPHKGVGWPYSKHLGLHYLLIFSQHFNYVPGTAPSALQILACLTLIKAL